MSDTALPAARDRLAHGPIPGVKRLFHAAFTLQV
jgi:hypothetical protein